MEPGCKSKDLTLKNIKNVLKQNGFASNHAKILGEQLDEVTPEFIEVAIHNHGGIGGSWDSILTDIIQQWLNNDVNKSWEKLAEALDYCNYKVIAGVIRGVPKSNPDEDKAGLRQRGHTMKSEQPQSHTSTRKGQQGMRWRTKASLLGVAIVIAIVVFWIIKLQVLEETVKDPNVSIKHPPQSQERPLDSHPETPNAEPMDDSVGCTKIRERKHLEKALAGISGVSPDKMCDVLKIRRTTCNTLDKRNMYSLSQKYMDQNPEPCWENIIMIFCEDLDHPTEAKNVQEKYRVSESVFTKYCK